MVDIESPETDVVNGALALPESFLDATSLLSERCTARAIKGASSFIVSGRGGIPPGPETVLPSPLKLGAGSEATSLILGFEDRSGTVIAALPGYVGTVVVDRGRVSNVSYVPSRNTWRWQDYVHMRERLDKLRALVATAARFVSFVSKARKKAGPREQSD